MLSEVEKAKGEVRKLYAEKIENGEETTLDICRDTYAKLMNNSNWKNYLDILKEIDIENKICPKCGNKPLFNPLVKCSKCGNDYDDNGDVVKEKHDDN